ncbi:Bacterial alpha-L-rhamnosidase [bacterium]|nr:Bacterial alpha-L-rhamnosidase [bacterium]
MRYSLILLLSLIFHAAQALNISHLRVEHLENPIGIDFENPRFSWVLESKEMAVVQEAYELEIFENGERIWHSGKKKSDNCYLVETDFKPQPKTRYQWQVRVWDNHKNTAQSAKTYFETGLMQLPFEAKWIAAPWDENPRDQNPVWCLRKEFTVTDKAEFARVYATAYGMYEIFINGIRLGNRELAPGWSSYGKRLKYQTYEVDEMLNIGQNVLSVRLAQGWYQGRIGYRGKNDENKNHMALLLQLEINNNDGSISKTTTDESWRIGTGGLRVASIYDGEVFDDRYESEGWNTARFDDSRWEQAKVLDLGYANLVADDEPPVTVIGSMNTVSQIVLDNNEVVYDFGQNLVGRVQLELNIAKPAEIVIEHAEILDENGEFYTDNLRSAKAAVVLRLSKKGQIQYTPSFTYMGFRYVRISGIAPSEIKAVHAQILSSQLERIGVFSCSDKMINRLYSNITWSQLGNFIDVPTDCPQRDERLGWTGDAQVFSTTAAYNMNVAAFFREWLANLAADQYADGAVPWVVPDVFQSERFPATGWADAATIIPWNMYAFYNDKRMLSESYPAMKKWVDFMLNNSHDNLWFGTTHFGDWLSYNPDDDREGKAAVTEKELLAQMFFMHSLDIMVKSASALQNAKDEEMYAAKFMQAQKAFLDEFVTPNGRLVSGTQTAYTLALAFDLLPENLRQQAADRLATNVRSYNHISTGFLGTPHISAVLSRYGYSNLAYMLLTRTEYPSWLYPVKMGATTIWERWDGVKTDSTLQNPTMNSFNHYAYGAIGSWLMGNVAGIKPMKHAEASEAGFKHFVIAPEINEALSFVNASYYSSYGLIATKWMQNGGRLTLSFIIPCNTKADVVFPENYNFFALKQYENEVESMVNFTNPPKGSLTLGSGTYLIEFMPAPAD